MREFCLRVRILSSEIMQRVRTMEVVLDSLIPLKSRESFVSNRPGMIFVSTKKQGNIELGSTTKTYLFLNSRIVPLIT